VPTRGPCGIPSIQELRAGVLGAALAFTDHIPHHAKFIQEKRQQMAAFSVENNSTSNMLKNATTAPSGS
jgi:hypothetical protein